MHVLRPRRDLTAQDVYKPRHHRAGGGQLSEITSFGGGTMDDDDYHPKPTAFRSRPARTEEWALGE